MRSLDRGRTRPADVSRPSRRRHRRGRRGRRTSPTTLTVTGLAADPCTALVAIGGAAAGDRRATPCAGRGVGARRRARLDDRSSRSTQPAPTRRGAARQPLAAAVRPAPRRHHERGGGGGVRRASSSAGRQRPRHGRARVRRRRAARRGPRHRQHVPGARRPAHPHARAAALRRRGQGPAAPLACCSRRRSSASPPPLVGLVLGVGARPGRRSWSWAALDLGVPLPSTIQVTLPVVLLPLLGRHRRDRARLPRARPRGDPGGPARRAAPGRARPRVGARGGRVRLALSLLLTSAASACCWLAALLLRQRSGRPDAAARRRGARRWRCRSSASCSAPCSGCRKVVVARRARPGAHRDQRAARGGEHRAQPAPDGRDQCGAADRRRPSSAMMSTGAASARVSLAQRARRALPRRPHGRRLGPRRRREPAGRRVRGRSRRSPASTGCSRCGAASRRWSDDDVDHGRGAAADGSPATCCATRARRTG